MSTNTKKKSKGNVLLAMATAHAVSETVIATLERTATVPSCNGPTSKQALEEEVTF
jgi:hypothetical protein